MQKYPWNESREAIEVFLKKKGDWILDLPEDLTEEDLRRLYQRHKPAEFVAFDMLAGYLITRTVPLISCARRIRCSSIGNSM